MYPNLPEKALSIMQPWAWLIVNGHKDIENRDWTTKFRGLVCIHAGKKEDVYAAEDLSLGIHPASGERIAAPNPLLSYPYPVDDQRGGIVGVAEIVECVAESESEWFFGGVNDKGKRRQGFVIRNARPVPFIPVKGALGFFDWRKNL